MNKNEIKALVRHVRITGGGRQDAADIQQALGERWIEVRHPLRQIRLGLADSQVMDAVEASLSLT